MKIIAFGHRRRVGKDCASRFLDTILKIEARHLKVRRVSFASKLKDLCSQIYGWAGLQDEQYYEDHPEYREEILVEIGLSPRDIWINVGNKFREVYRNTWLDYAMRGVKADIVIISDMRFENEAKRVRELGGMLIKLTRSAAPISNDVSDSALDKWTDWDKIIDNSGTMSSLNSQMDQLAKELIGD